MIFITLGTQDKPFNRLLCLVQEEVNKKNINEKIVVQAGYTKFTSKDMEVFDYLSPKEFEKYIKECDLLITHGGVGNILSGLRENKKVIAIPRLSKYGEHTNDHQLEIVNNFSKQGYILECNDNQNFLDVYNESKKFKPKKRKFDNTKIIKNLKEFIDNN